MKADFLPVILGTDSNAYGMAKAFHMAYGIKSLVVGQGALFTTSNSKILDLRIVDHFADPDQFVHHLTDIALAQKETYQKLILVASSDGYVELIINNKEALEQHYVVPFINADLMKTLNSKEGFYETCEKHHLNYPKTQIARVDVLPELESWIKALPFDYPVVLKPSDSMRYFEAKFEGKQKAYIIENAEDLKRAIESIYASSYQEALILQEYISGDDTAMRVLNCVSGPDGKVKLMCLGQPLLEDCTPTLIGNYTAIIDAYDAAIFEEYKQFLEGIGYVGFSNFDLKYDVKTGTYKVFEINLRQGRSSFFVTGSGYNQAAYLVEAFVYGNQDPVVYADKPHLWLGIPFSVLLKYISDRKLARRAMTLMKEDKTSTTLYYKQDKSIMRTLRVFRYYESYKKKYKQYFVKKK